MLPGTGQTVKKGGFTAVGIADDCDGIGCLLLPENFKLVVASI
jgi:hypothetical protein